MGNFGGILRIFSRRMACCKKNEMGFGIGADMKARLGQPSFFGVLLAEAQVAAISRRA
jgi:hypothetical protein